MVHVVIHPHQRSDKTEELLYLDFQGSFESADNIDVSNIEIGDFTLKEDSAILIIGHHKLVGKKVKLPKPYAVIHKRKVEDDIMIDDRNDGVCYDVVTILREKYVFSGRPGLIVQESLRGLTRIGK
jgi:chromosome transmission fidelity protein 8